MRILISNDDGIFAKGIRTLANAIASCDHEVVVVAPDRERSATGHGLTLHQPIRADIIEGIFHEKVTAWSCSGTPSDCVKLALSAILKDNPRFCSFRNKSRLKLRNRYIVLRNSVCRHGGYNGRNYKHCL